MEVVLQRRAGDEEVTYGTSQYEFNEGNCYLTLPNAVFQCAEEIKGTLSFTKSKRKAMAAAGKSQVYAAKGRVLEGSKISFGGMICQLPAVNHEINTVLYVRFEFY